MQQPQLLLYALSHMSDNCTIASCPAGHNLSFPYTHHMTHPSLLDPCIDNHALSLHLTNYSMLCRENLMHGNRRVVGMVYVLLGQHCMATRCRQSHKPTCLNTNTADLLLVWQATTVNTHSAAKTAAISNVQQGSTAAYLHKPRGLVLLPQRGPLADLIETVVRAVAGAAAAALDSLEQVTALQGVSCIPGLHNQSVECCLGVWLRGLSLLGSRAAAAAACVGLVVAVAFMVVVILSATAAVPKLAMQELSGARSLVVYCDAATVCCSSCC